MTTFARLLADLAPLNSDHALVFVTDAGEIGAGYHVTELRHAAATGIDCGGKIDKWFETRLQLLDGQGGTHMQVGKFCEILRRSLKALPELAQAPLLAEFGPQNATLQLMSIGTPQIQADRVLLPLTPATAVCKPIQRIGDAAAARCSTPAQPDITACCGAALTPSADSRCCA